MKSFKVTVGGKVFIYQAKSESTLRRRIGKFAKAMGAKISEVK